MCPLNSEEPCFPEGEKKTSWTILTGCILGSLFGVCIGTLAKSYLGLTVHEREIQNEMQMNGSCSCQQVLFINY